MHPLTRRLVRTTVVAALAVSALSTVGVSTIAAAGAIEPLENPIPHTRIEPVENPIIWF